MTSKSLYFKLMREEAKRRIWAAALAFLVFFFMFPVNVALSAGNMEEDYERFVRGLRSLFGMQNGGVATVVLGASLVLAVTGFSYLHSRQKTDFYHGIPVKRGMLFAVNYACGILLIAIPYLLNVLAGVAAARMYGVAGVGLMGIAFKSFGFFMVHFILLYATAVLAMILTGNVLVGILGTGVFHFYLPLTIAVIQGYQMAFFTTSRLDGTSFINRVVKVSSPCMMFFSQMDVWNEDGLTALGEKAAAVAAVLLAAAAVTALAVFLYGKRPSEAAGRAMAFPASRPVIKIPIVVSSSLAGGLLFWEMRSYLGWAVFGLACGLVLSHCIIEIIYHFDFRKLFARRGQLAVCAAAAGIIFCGFRYDLMGYDSYMPRAEDLKSAAVCIGELSGWVECSYAKQEGDGSYSWRYKNPEEYALENMKLKTYEELFDIVEEGIERNQRYKRAGYRRYSSEWLEDEGEYRSSVAVEYVLKSGRRVRREYVIPLSSVLESVEALYEKPEYKEGSFPILKQTPEETATVYYEERGDRRHVNIGKSMGTEGELAELLRVYQQELAGLSAEDLREEAPVARLQFPTDIFVEAAQQNHWEFDRAAGSYPIFPSFQKTLALLKRYGIEPGDYKREVEQVEVILGGEPRDTENYAYDEDKEEWSLIITEPAQVREIMEAAVYEEYWAYKSFEDYDGISVWVTTGKGADSRTDRYYLEEEDIPDFLEQALNP